MVRDAYRTRLGRLGFALAIGASLRIAAWTLLDRVLQ